MADIFSSKRIEEMMQKAAHGKEPDAMDINYEQPGYTIALMRAFNWYNYEKDLKTARSYLRSWVKKHQPQLVKNFDAVPDLYMRPVYGWLARLEEHGAKLSPREALKLRVIVDDMMTKAKTAPAEPVVEDTVRRPSIQDAMLEKQREFLGHLEGEFDNFILNDCKPTDFDAFKYMQSNNTARPYAQALNELFTGRLQEFSSAVLNAPDQIIDEQIVEAYGCYTQRELQRIVTWLQTVIADTNRYVNFKKANQKVRVKKAKPAGVQVAKLKYLREFTELGLTSISPTKIIGAAQLWVYNTKNKKLGCYYAAGATGFSVRGTSLQGYDPDVSTQNALRKPEVVIPQVLEGGKLQLRTLLQKLTTKNTPLNGRINEDTMLLRIL